MPTPEAKQAGQIAVGYIAACTAGRPEDAEALLGTIDNDVLWRKLARISLNYAAQFFAGYTAAAGRDPAETARRLALDVAKWVDEQPDL